jgi:hypothetical protein
MKAKSAQTRIMPTLAASSEFAVSSAEFFIFGSSALFYAR